ncbi:L-methionine (R)-S-oxide reductase [Starmerella bacillaris]|uniref:L-methionine (R)-S-oxide reductase n=1 Tax=Starmerella bacillaris TaxID=1247836 RepID=A0AAV5RHB2_STABA|nr:L-methionine (R)-S-oxide reductase [Starmerella bacillaris]
MSASSKIDSYELLLTQMEALLVSNWVSNLANASALLWEHFHTQQKPQSEVNWAGFYTYNSSKQILELGPFQGKIACQIIEIGKGVCGTSVQKKQTQLIVDVHEFPGHIACDAASNSEIVVPILSENQEVLGVIDIDCKEINGFDQVDQKYLERLASLLASKFEN